MSRRANAESYGTGENNGYFPEHHAPGYPQEGKLTYRELLAEAKQEEAAAAFMKSMNYDPSGEETGRSAEKYILAYADKQVQEQADGRALSDPIERLKFLNRLNDARDSAAANLNRMEYSPEEKNAAAEQLDHTMANLYHRTEGTMTYPQKPAESTEAALNHAEGPTERPDWLDRNAADNPALGILQERYRAATEQFPASGGLDHREQERHRRILEQMDRMGERTASEGFTEDNEFSLSAYEKEYPEAANALYQRDLGPAWNSSQEEATERVLRLAYGKNSSNIEQHLEGLRQYAKDMYYPEKPPGYEQNPENIFDIIHHGGSALGHLVHHAEERIEHSAEMARTMAETAARHSDALERLRDNTISAEERLELQRVERESATYISETAPQMAEALRDIDFNLQTINNNWVPAQNVKSAWQERMEAVQHAEASPAAPEPEEKRSMADKMLGWLRPRSTH